MSVASAHLRGGRPRGLWKGRLFKAYLYFSLFIGFVTLGALLLTTGSLILALAFHAASSAEDWPAFRGPTGQGHSTEQGLPLEWSESRNITWKVPLPGAGWSSM